MASPHRCVPLDIPVGAEYPPSPIEEIMETPTTTMDSTALPDLSGEDSSEVISELDSLSLLEDVSDGHITPEVKAKPGPRVSDSAIYLSRPVVTKSRLRHSMGDTPRPRTPSQHGLRERALMNSLSQSPEALTATSESNPPSPDPSGGVVMSPPMSSSLDDGERVVSSFAARIYHSEGGEERDHPEDVGHDVPDDVESWQQDLNQSSPKQIAVGCKKVYEILERQDVKIQQLFGRVFGQREGVGEVMPPQGGAQPVFVPPPQAGLVYPPPPPHFNVYCPSCHCVFDPRRASHFTPMPC